MTHLFQPNQPFYKSPAFALAVAAALVLWALFSMTSCRDIDPPKTLEEKLHGAWERNHMGFVQTWSFDDGQCLAYSIIPAQPVQLYVVSYACEGDTLTLINLAASSDFRDDRRAIVTFSEDGDTARLAWLGGVDYVLIRL